MLENIRNILAVTQDKVNVEELPQQAEQIHESIKHSNTYQVHAVNAVPDSNYGPRSRERETDVTHAPLLKSLTVNTKNFVLEARMDRMQDTSQHFQGHGRPQYDNS